jgi:C4-dicarboxylate transporter, DctM subunit
MESLILFFAVFLFLLFLGVPVATSLGFTSALLILKYHLGIMVFSANFYASVAKFQLLALPFFVLAGLLLDRCGISKRLIHLISLIVGPIPGGLAIVTIIVGIIFAGISGSGPADTAALGTILYPSMIMMGYNKGYTSALIAATGSLAIVIPPSIAFIIYGVITNTSVPALFAAGVVPGIMTAMFLIIPSFFIAKKYGWKGERWGTRKEIWVAFKEAIWGLLAPAVILSGIYGGIFTATEAAVVAVFYGFFVGFVIYRSLTLEILYGIFRDAVLSSAVVMFIVAFAGLFSWTGSNARRHGQDVLLPSFALFEPPCHSPLNQPDPLYRRHAHGCHFNLLCISSYSHSHHLVLPLGPHLVWSYDDSEPGDRTDHATRCSQPLCHCQYRRSSP